MHTRNGRRKRVKLAHLWFHDPHCSGTKFNFQYSFINYLITVVTIWDSHRSVAGDLWAPPGSLGPLRPVGRASTCGGGCSPLWSLSLFLILQFYFSINLLPVYLNLQTKRIKYLINSNGLVDWRELVEWRGLVEWRQWNQCISTWTIKCNKNF